MANRSFPLKTIIGCVILVVVIATAGFLYRNGIEQDKAGMMASGAPVGQACTAEAKICPDGSAVGRTGPNCSFAACALPNVELAAASSTIGFVLPAGYTAGDSNSSNASVLGTYQKPTATAGTNDTLTVSAYQIALGESANTILLANTVYDPSSEQATTTSNFKTVVAGKNTFYVVDIGRYEGQVETAYYLVTDTIVYRIDLIERGVTNWTDPALNTSTLPEHRSLTELLSTVQVSSK